jgi:hypothetical protein
MSTALEAASLIMIPTSYSDGLLASVKPNDGAGDFTFARCNGAAQCDLAATRVNADGNIEKGYENLLLQSNSFTTTPWVQVSILPPTSGQTGYDGSNDAWYFEKTGAFGRLQQSISTSGVETFSVYLKAKDSSWVNIETSGASTSRQYFDLTAPIETAKGLSNNIISSSIEDAGNGWRKCSITYEGPKTFLFIFIAEESGRINGTTGSLYIQDAMLNQGMVAYPYVETTTASVAAGILEDMPRIDFSGGNQSLLLEPSRTNRCTFSEYFRGAAWLSIGSLTITTNYGISPEGVKNSTRIQFSGTNQCIYDGISYTSEEVSTIYVKGTSGETIKFGKGDNIFVGDIFTLDGTWQRLKFVQSVSGNTFTINTSGGATARDIEIWGAQNEEGSYPTSYIPTYGVSQTRLADDAYITSASSIINSEEGVLFCEVEALNEVLESFFEFKISNGLNQVRIQLPPNSNIQGAVFDGGYQALINHSATRKQNNKIAFKYKVNDFALFINGVKVGSDTSGTTFSANFLNRIDIGNEAKVKQALLFPTVLSDDECITLTTI